jgi:uncharacterized cofD-like protein
MGSKIRWLYPGMKIKRWMVLSLAGILLIVFSTATYVKEKSYFTLPLAILGVIGGTLLIIIGIREIMRSVLSLFIPQGSKNLVDRIFEKRQLGKGPNIVAIGGGTGLSTLLQGIKEFTANTTAIVTVADDGGSSGRLREEFDTLPPGDIRNCLVALADAEPLMRDLFQFRFPSNSELKGHNFGNLFITALSQVTGDFEKAIKESSRVLAIKGRVVPSTLTKVKLIAEHENGKVTIGESKIPKVRIKIKRILLEPQNCKPTYEAIDALLKADAIILGPGSLYTSVIPNLLVPGILEAILNSHASKLYICNIMTEAGETDEYKASDHVKALIKHTSPKLIDYCVVNIEEIPIYMLEKYKQEEAYPVEPDIMNIESLGYKTVVGKFLSIGEVVRHDAHKVASSIIEIISEQESTH